MKKRALIISAIAAIILPTILMLFIDALWLRAVHHALFRAVAVGLILVVLKKNFEPLTEMDMRYPLIICGAVLTLDMVILETVRYVVREEISTALFLPVSLPICIMVVLLKQKSPATRRAALLIGIPLTILALYLEIISFAT
ncbi:MAG: hypothetical protein E7617_08075 [Ruminococcaceae bacterium]|nr:hypothetical protein [Oscillospiraceae bacterium]